MEKNYRSVLRAGGLILLCLFLSAGAVFAETGREIMDRVIDNQKSGSSAMDIRMTLIDSRGNESVRRIQTLMMDDDGNTRSITLFLEPANVKNTRFLTIQNEDRADDQWIYLPSLRKTRRIASGEKDGSFMGSDFYYSDMGAGDLDDADYTIIGEEQFGGRDCWIIEAVPGAGSDSPYGKTVSWVDKENYLAMKVAFFGDDGATQIKELTMEGPRQIDGYWSAEKTTMKTLDSGHRTELEIRQVKYDIPVNPGYFTTNFLQTGRP